MRVCPSCGDNAHHSAGHALMVCEFCGYRDEVTAPSNYGRKARVLDGRPRKGGRILPIFYDEENDQ
jgi:hypothetical protein